MIFIRIIGSVIISLALMLNTTYAGIWDALPLPHAGNFIRAGNNETGNLNTANLVEKVDTSLNQGLTSILRLVYQIGGLVAVCVLAFMGVQFIIASPQQKAQIKASLVPYFVGLLFFLAGVPIAILIINIFTEVL